MNKYLKTTILMFIIGFLIMPNIVFSAWWNPLTWFNKNSEYQENIQIINQDKRLDIIDQNEEKILDTTKTKETQTINNSQHYIDQIIELKKEVNSLKEDLNSTQQSLNNLLHFTESQLNNNSNEKKLTQQINDLEKLIKSVVNRLDDSDINEVNKRISGIESQFSNQNKILIDRTKEMAEYINALLHAGSDHSSNIRKGNSLYPLRCFLGQKPERVSYSGESFFYPTCTSVYSNLNY